MACEKISTSHIYRGSSHLPVAGTMFRQDTDKSFKTTQDGSMNHDRSHEVVLSLLSRGSVLKLETFRQVEIELQSCQQGISNTGQTDFTHLNSGALEFSLERVTDSDIDLGTVELQTD